MNINDYISSLDKAYKLGNATEHTYRKYLQDLVETLDPTVTATNEPARIKCGAPDYIVTKKDIPLGYIEAKDIERLTKFTDAEKRQFDRYTESLDNLIYTDYIEFVFYKSAQEVSRVKLAEVENGELKPLPENFEKFTSLIKDFTNYHGITIKSSKKLAEMMANKARLMSIVIHTALIKTDDDYENQTLKEHYNSFKDILIHDIEPQEFANVYAQTIAYGMFSARLNDTTLDTFTRQEAAELIPKSNPFLRKLFGYIAGPDLDDRIKWVVDGLAEIFNHTNVAEIMKNYGQTTKQTDPVIHFYETFLGEFDPALRKARGVWYTPDPVVGYIVRAVDEVLKNDFNLPMGLADTAKTKIKVKTQTFDKRTTGGVKEIEQEVHKVQILDPATGTGTFLAETIKQIHSNFEGQDGLWNKYVAEHLKPRIHGFELLMASYAMAHLKLDLLLKDTGYVAKDDKRLNIYLTNSLEEAHPDTGTLFANWLSNEANEANHIKREVPVMAVIGNPPYSGESSNNGEWILDLLDVYKQEPSGGKLQERNSKWINDDYVKFIRYAEQYVEKNGKGVIGYINNNSFLDNPTFRGMRHHLLKTFDKVYIVDLHGNSKKKETCPDGSPDSNVFDIMAGVSINIFVKTGEKKKDQLATVYHKDLYGKRDIKYDFCRENNLESTKFKKLKPVEPYYFFVPKDFANKDEYEKGFKLTDLFPIYSAGVVSGRDDFVIDIKKEKLKDKILDFFELENPELLYKYKLKEKNGFKIDEIKYSLKEFNSNFIEKISYKPFDTRFIYYKSEFLERNRKNTMKHFINKDNLAISVGKQCVSDWRYCFITKDLATLNLTGTAGRLGSGFVFPLYIYEDDTPTLIKGDE